jgi:WD40 repeat protein
MLRDYEYERGKLLADRAVNSVGFDPSGTYVVAVFDDFKGRIWRWKDGAGPIELNHPDKVYAGQFTPGGDHVITALGDGSLSLWRTEGVLDTTFSARDKLTPFFKD